MAHLLPLYRTLRLDAAVASVGFLWGGIHGVLVALVVAEAVRFAARFIP